VISLLRPDLPFTWFSAVGGNQLRGRDRAGPEWMQRSGLEWTYRLAESRAGSPAYLRHDAPYAIRLLTTRSPAACVGHWSTRARGLK